MLINENLIRMPLQLEYVRVILQWKPDFPTITELM